VLCLGRRDSTKNTDFIVHAFFEYKLNNPGSDLYLVLAGPGGHSYENRDKGIFDLGLVSNEQKVALLRNCLTLTIPSKNESFSRVMMEAWHCKKPVVAHRDCLATSVAVQSAKGGLLAGDVDEWLEVFSKIYRSSSTKMASYGENGYKYALENADWDKVICRYEKILGLKEKTTIHKKKKLKFKKIHQLLPNLSYGDAISNHALDIQACLRSRGYDSEIFVRYVDERSAPKCKIADKKCIRSNAGLLYHHSIGSEVTPLAIAHAGPKCLIYHNITPSKFFMPYRPQFATLLENGRKEMKALAKSFKVFASVSAFNASELTGEGFKNPGVLPILVEPAKWGYNPDEGLMRQLQDGKTNLLFVGRIAPNKCQHHLVEAFMHYLAMNSNARLVIVGSYVPEDPYTKYLQEHISKNGLDKHVIITGMVNDEQLLAYYRTAHLFCSMSEHEGFCVPLIEAMWFDIPVIAYKSSAIPETLGASGIMFTSKEDLLQVAALAKVVLTDNSLREKILNQQRIKREQYLLPQFEKQLDNIISMMEMA